MKYRILSIDGGGSRAILSAQILANLQKQTSSNLLSHFDLVAGSSAGSIIALALTSKLATPNDLPDLFEDMAPKIFKKRRLKKGAFRPRYSGQVLNDQLFDFFGKVRLNHLAVDTIVPTYSVSANRAVFFKSWKQSQSLVNVWEVARASSSAPTFFPAHRMRTTSDLKSTSKESLIDGGIVANNPSVCAISELLSRGIRPNDIEVISIGSGGQVSPLSHSQAQKFGLVQYAKPLIPILFDGDSDSVDYIAKSIVGKYTRLQIDHLPSELKRMDISDKRKLRALKKQANALSAQISKIALR